MIESLKKHLKVKRPYWLIHHIRVSEHGYYDVCYTHAVVESFKYNSGRWQYGCINRWYDKITGKLLEGYKDVPPPVSVYCD